ncbi:MAG: S9 family peptidase [Bacteroidia bacterium]
MRSLQLAGLSLLYLMHAQVPIIDRELFFGDPVFANVQISPDGKWISFTRRHEGQLNIWLLPRGQALEKAFPITASSKRPITSYFWSPDSKYLFYALDKDGDENTHIYRIALAQVKVGEMPPALDLTPIEGVKALIYAVPKFKPGYIYVGLNDRDPSIFDLYEIETETGKRQKIRENTQNVLSWGIDEYGRLRTASKMGPEGETEIYLVEKDDLRLIHKTTWEESAGIVHLPKTPDILYLITNHNSDLTRLVELNLKTQKEKVLHQDPLQRVDLGTAVFDDLTDRLLYTVYLDDTPRVYFFDKKLQADYKYLRSQLPGYQFSLSQTDDKTLAIVRAYNDTDPGRYYLYDKKNTKNRLQFLGTPYPDLPIEHLAPRKGIRIQARDGLSLPAFLTVPKVGTPPYPTVLLVHGGPWAQDAWGYDALAQLLANRGYLVLQVNYRGSTGYGKKFLNAGNKEWGIGKMQHDLTDAVKYLTNQKLADPKRIAIMGGSYGGYATLAGLTFTPELYACGVDIVGPSSILTLIRSFPPYWRPLIKSIHNRVGNPDDPQDAERLRQQSPLYHVEKIRAPLLIIQGANDPRVKQFESDQIVVALRDKGIPVQYLLAEDEGHGYQKYENRIAMMVAVENFLAQHIGGRVQPQVPLPIQQRLQNLQQNISQVKAQAASEFPPLTLKLPYQEPKTFRFMYNIRTLTRQQNLRAIHRWTPQTESTWLFVEEIEDIQKDTRIALDSLHVDKRNFTLSSRHMIQGNLLEMQASYHDGTVKGFFKMGPNTTTIEGNIGHDVYPETMALLYGIASLQLYADLEGMIPVYALQTQQETQAKLKVLGREELTVLGKTCDCWKISLEIDNTRTTAWIDPQTREVMRFEAKVQGATISAERLP